VGSIVLATAVGVVAGGVAASMTMDDPSFVAVPILASAAVALGGTGLVLCLSNLPGPAATPKPGEASAHAAGPVRPTGAAALMPTPGLTLRYNY
jgi:hypothetical protein